MPNSAPTDSGNSRYEAFLGQLDEEPTAAELEGWARRHADDPDAERALMDAAHQGGFDGDHAQALELFCEVHRRGGELAHLAHAGIVEELFALGRAAEADDQLVALRRDLDAAPDPDLDVYADVAVLLDEQHRGDEAIAWCEAGLARPSRPAAAEEEGILPPARARMLTLRSELRQERGLEPDALDKQAEEEDERSREAVRSLFEALEEAVPRQRAGLPDDGAAYNAVILHWPEPEFTAVRERWPETTALYGDEYRDYCALLQREAQGYSDAGAARTLVVHGTLDDFAAYAQHTGKDPAERQTRRDYGEWCAAHRPERALAWPPPRNGPCWCGSGRKYKKCCGSPSFT